MKNSQSHTLSSKQKTNRILSLLTILTILITIVIITQFMFLDIQTNKLLEDGTIINGYNLSGMSKSEANVVLINKFKERAEDFNLTISDSMSDKVWTMDKDDFSVNTNIHTVLDMSQDREALLGEVGEKTLISQFDKIGGNVSMAFNYIYVGLDEKIEEIIASVEIEPVDSTITFDTNKKELFLITDSTNGKRVNKEKLYRDINEQFLSNDNISVEIEYIDEIASITKEYNEGLTHLISSFSTNVADSTGGRKHNVKLALKSFDGMIINPGECVSFNNIVGEQTLERGYQSATIIYNGEFTDGIGGGVCQASTTLYNALLLSGIEINEVHKHTLPVKYVPPALDAMVAEYTSDLKFTNNTEYPIYIHTYSDSQSVTVDIYSCPSEYTYKTRSEILETIDSPGDKIIPDTEGKYAKHILFKGEYYRKSYPKAGHEAKAYLQKYLKDTLIEEKEIRHEIYQPQKGIVYEGVEELPTGVSPIDTGVVIYN
ncbi:MAG: hypothetical protein E7354_04760 [Clostridiales bacterium]|nr:hypothetical protein [Clostridiales bacterium]